MNHTLMKAVIPHPNPAVTSSRRQGETKLLVVDRLKQQVLHRKFASLPEFLNPGDWLIVNRAATLPSSFEGVHKESGESLELRLAAVLGPENRWLVVVFGRGEWKTPTEKRIAPPNLKIGDRIYIAANLSVTIHKICAEISERLIEVEFSETGSKLWRDLYDYGRPIQYSYLKEEVKVWDQQTIFSTTPISVEPPSAGFAFDWKLIFELMDKGVNIGSILHATGLSDTGDPNINSALPLPEMSSVDPALGLNLLQAKKNGRRVVAVGTGVVRALETWVRDQKRVGLQLTDLKIKDKEQPLLANALITGLHESGASHLDLLNAFAQDEELLRRAYSEAREKNYLWHEYGDLNLVI